MQAKAWAAALTAVALCVGSVGAVALASHRPVAPHWITVASFRGDSTGQTQPFKVTNRWRIVWRSSPGAISGNFAAQIEQPGQSLPIGLAGNVMGTGHGISNEYQAGTFYLGLQADERYVVTVETMAVRLPKQPSYHWRTVATFHGGAQAQTSPFKVKSPWRVVWKSSPGAMSGNFAVDVDQPGQTLPADSFANVMGQDAGTAYEYTSGSFFLSVNADENFTAVVEQGR